MTDELKLTASETLRITASRPDLLEVEATYGAAGKPPPPHLHPSQDEEFEVLEGSLRAVVGGMQRDLAAGERLEVPRKTVHKMWNPGETRAVVRWRTRPAGRTEEWFRAIDRLQREREKRGRISSALDFATLIGEYDDVFRLAARPRVLIRTAIALAGTLNRLRVGRAAN